MSFISPPRFALLSMYVISRALLPRSSYMPRRYESRVYVVKIFMVTSNYI